MSGETLLRYIAGVILVAVASLVLAVIKRSRPSEILRETVRMALYIYGGALAIGLVAYLVCVLK